MRNKRRGDGSFSRLGPDLINPVSAADSDAAANLEGGRVWGGGFSGETEGL